MVSLLVRFPSAAAAVILLSLPPAAQGTRVSGSMDIQAGIPGGDVGQFEADSAAQHAFYVADEAFLGTTEIFRAPLDGSSAAQRVHPPLIPDMRVVDFKVSPDGSRILYRFSTVRRNQLFSRSSDGSGPAVKLHPDLVSNSDGVSHYEISPDGTTVVYRAEQNDHFLHEIFSVPIDGSAAPVPLHPLQTVTDFAISATGTHVVFISYANDHFALWSVPIDGSAAPTRLSGALGANVDVKSFQISSDGSGVAFTTDLPNNSAPWNLHHAPVDGSGPPTGLGGVVGLSIRSWRYAPIGPGNGGVGRVVARMGPGNAGGIKRIFAAPVDGSAPLTALHDESVNMEDDYQISPGGGLVAFRPVGALSPDLFIAAIDAGSPAIKLTRPAGAPQNVPSGSAQFVFRFDPTGRRLVYRTDSNQDGIFELLAFRIGPGPPRARRFDGPGALGRVVRLTREGDPNKELVFTPDGKQLVFRMDAGLDGVQELFVVPTNGSALPSRLSDELGNPADVRSDFKLAGNRVLYQADRDFNEVIELFSAPLDGAGPAAKLNGTLAPNDILGDVFDFLISPDEEWAVYRADADQDEVVEYYSVSLTTGAGPFRLNLPPAGNLFRFEITSDSARVVFNGYQDCFPCSELFSVPIDGSLPPVQLDTEDPSTDVAEWRLAPDGARVVYRVVGTGLGEDALFSTAVDGSEVPVDIGAPVNVDYDIDGDFFISPDSQWVLFGAPQSTSPSPDILFSVPIDGSLAPVQLSELPISFINYYEITADSARVVYTHSFSGDTQLLSVPIDGSSAPLNLNGYTDRGVRDFVLTPDGAKAVYREALDVVPLELFVVDVDGSSAPLKLSGPLVAGGSVDSQPFGQAAHRLSNDGTRVAYTADANINGVFELFTVPIDGSTAAVQINPPFTLGTGANVQPDFEFTADGNRVLYRADAFTDFEFRLFSAPADGGAGPIVLDDPPVLGGDVRRFEVGPEEVVWFADSRVVDAVELFTAPPSGGSPVLLNRPLPAGGTVVEEIYYTERFAIDASGRVFYMAEQDTNNVVELYYSDLP